MPNIIENGHKGDSTFYVYKIRTLFLAFECERPPLRPDLTTPDPINVIITGR